ASGWYLTGHVGNMLYLTGAWEELERLWHEADRQRDDPAAELGLFAIDFTWGLVQGLGRGDVDAFLRIVEWLRKLEDSEEFQGRTFAEILLSQIALVTGAPGEAIERTDRVLNARNLLGFSHWLYKVGVELALQAALALDDLEHAESVMTGVRAIPPGERTPLLDATIAGYGSRVASRLGGDD